MNRRNCGPVLLGALGAAIAVSAAIAPDVAWGQHPQRPRSTAHATQSHARAVPKVEKPRDLVRRFLAMASRESGPGSAHNRYTYEALVETPAIAVGGKHVGQRSLILADKKKFCIKTENLWTHAALPTGTPTSAVRGKPDYDIWWLYDGGSPDIVWRFCPSGRSRGLPRPQDRDWRSQISWLQAGCCPETTSSLLGLAARRDGLDAVINRYGLCADLAPGEDPMVFSRQPRQVQLDPLAPKEALLGPRSSHVRKVGRGVVAGCLCTIFDSDHQISIRDTAGTRLWVEVRTKLVLKRESRLIKGDLSASNVAVAESKLPPQTQRELKDHSDHLVHRGDFEVKNIKFYKSLPPSLFEIPAGTKVIFTALMTDIGVKAPKGVIRIPYMTNDKLPSYEVDPDDQRQLLSKP